jgi:hypothetical protein
LIRNEKKIVLFEKNCHATVKSKAIASAWICLVILVNRVVDMKRIIKIGGPRRRRGIKKKIALAGWGANPGSVSIHFLHFKWVLRGRCYDHNFLRFFPIFGEKIGVLLENQCYDQFFQNLALF